MYGIHTIYWSFSTLYLYMAIIFISFIIAAQRKKLLTFGKGTTLKMDYRILIVTLILVFYKGFGATGRDLNTGYYINYLTASSISSFRDQSVEIGFRLLNVIIKNVFDNYTVLVFIETIITIIPVYYIINKYSNNIDIAAATLIYTSIYYFSSYSAARQYMAVSICLLAFDAMLERRLWKALIIIGIATTIHTTSIFMIIPYIVVLFKYLSKKMIAFSAVMAFILIYFMRDSFETLLTGRYAIYTTFSAVNIGIRCFIYYIPICLIFLLGVKKDNDKFFSRMSITFISLGFLFGMLEYIVSIFGRLEAFTLPFVIIIPYYIYKIKTKKNKLLIYSFLITYCVLRFWIFISENYNQQDLMPYVNIFGFTI